MNVRFAEFTYYVIARNEVNKKQANLYLKLAQNKISKKKYFLVQESIDGKQRIGAVGFNWETLKRDFPEKYEHELAHKKIYDNYDIESKLYWDYKENEPFVMDSNFKEVADRKDYDREKVKDILAKMLYAPYDPNKIKTEEKLKEHAFDLACYEILEGNIKEISCDQFMKALKKYELEL